MRYVEHLKRARADTSGAFFAASPEYQKLAETVCQLTFSCALSIEQKVKLTKYQHALLASFVRSTVVSCELVVNSELIEAVTILRKQVELLARLYELEEHEFEKLSGRTPNVRGLKSKLKRMYSPYSEGAHSATYGSMSLLGFYDNRKRIAHIFYPEFTENTEIIFQNWLFVFFEFTLWVIAFKTANIEGYESAGDEAEFMEVMSAYRRSGLDQKFKGKHGN